MKRIILLLTVLFLLFSTIPAFETFAGEQKEVVLLTFDNENERSEISSPDGADLCGVKASKVSKNRKSAYCEISDTQSFYIKLTPHWNSSDYKKPLGIRFYSLTDIDAEAKISAILTKDSVSSTGKTLNLDQTALSSTENPFYARLSGTVTDYNYIRFTVTSDTPVEVFIDNITLVYSSTAENLFRHINSYTGIYDWESGTKGATQNGNSFSRSRNISFPEIENSKYALKCTGSYGGTDNYISVDTKGIIPENVKTVRVALFCGMSSDDNPVKAGIKSGDKIYWSETVDTVNRYFWYYFDEYTFTAEDGTCFNDSLSKVESLLFSFGNTYSKFYLDDIQIGKTEEFSITIDGIKTDNCTLFTLPSSNKSGFIVYTDGTDYFEENETVTLSKNTELKSVSVGEVKTQSTASVRLGKITGLRFYTVLDTEALASLPEEAVVTKGTYIGPKDIFDGSDIRPISDNPNNFNCVDVKYTSSQYFENNNTIVGTISDIRDKNISREFNAVGYIQVKLGNITKTVLSAPTTKSIKTIASLFREDPENKALYNAYKELVDKWADYK